MRQFYKDTDFRYFFEQNKPEYNKIINNYAHENEVIKYVTMIATYLGAETKEYTVIISALLTDCYAMKILTNEQTILNYSVMCAYDYKDNKYIFGVDYSVKELLWHEISHLTINDLTKKYIDQFNIHEKTVPDNFVKIFYTTIETIINEYIIRAITIRLFEIHHEENITEYLLQCHVQKGFKEIESIKNYIAKNCEENNKLIKNEKYKELMDYVINKI